MEQQLPNIQHLLERLGTALRTVAPTGSYGSGLMVLEASVQAWNAFMEWIELSSSRVNLLPAEGLRLMTSPPMTYIGTPGPPGIAEDNDAVTSYARSLNEVLAAVLKRVLEPYMPPAPDFGATPDPTPAPDTMRQVREALARSVLYDQLITAKQEAALAAVDARNEAEEVRKERGARAAETLTGDYKALANKEANTAYRFRTAAITTVVAAVAVGIIVAVWVPSESVLEGTVHQVAAVAVVLGLAGYCARQSAIHRNVAVWADVTALHLATFDDFVRPIADVGLRESIRQQFASKLYGSMPAESAQKADGAAADITWMQHMLTAMVATNAQSKTPPNGA